MDLFDIVAYVSMLLLPFIVYRISRSDEKDGQKRKKAWYYVLKRILCRWEVERYVNRKVELPSDVPQEPEDYLDEDLLVFHGCDLNNNAFFLRFGVSQSKMLQNYAEILLEMRFQDGRILQLVEKIALVPLKRREWRTKMLTITSQLNGNYRICFNGFLKEVPNKDSRGANNDIQHVTFNFLFSCTSNSMSYPKFFDQGLFADAICKEKWRDGNWTQKLGDTVGEENFGCIHGTIKSTKFGIDSTWNLVGHQSRLFGTAARCDVKRSISLLAIVQDGTLIHINKQHKDSLNVPRVVFRFQYGAVLLSNGICQPIEACNLHLPDTDELLGDMCVRIRVNRANLNVVLHVQPDSGTTYTSSQGPGWILKNTMAELIIPKFRGKASLLTFQRVIKSAESHGPTEYGFADTHDQSYESKSFILPLVSPHAQNVQISGGKGCSLAILTCLQKELNFKVPSGFVLTTRALDAQIEDLNDLQEALAVLKKAQDVKSLKSACERVEDLLRSTPLQKDLTTEILEFLRIFDKVSSWAVRSSGLTEDSENFSAAGQNKTLLGCKLPEEVLRGIRECWASLFSFTSVEYRRQRGLPLETRMAVVVQEMVDARIAGVLFTCDLDGDASNIRICSNYGLGESIVSGEVGGDVITINRTWSNDLTIDSYQVGEKKTKKILNPKTGTVNVPVESQHTLCMSLENEAIPLAKVAVGLEKRFDHHLDIEWAFDDNGLVLLQARPVTYLDNWTAYELEHEFDHAVVSGENMYTSANVKEVLPGAVTPLTNSTVCTIVDQAISHCLHPNRINQRRRIMITMRHHIFMDFYQLLHNPPSEINLSLSASEYGFFGHSVTTSNMLERALHIHGPTTPMKIFGILCKVAKYWYITPGNLKRAHQLAASSMLLDKQMNLEKMVSLLDLQLTDLRKVALIHAISSVTSSVFITIATMVIGSQGDGKLSPEKFGQLSLLLTGSGVISANVPKHLANIADIIRKADSGLRETFLEMNANDDVLTWLGTHIPDAHRKLEEFLTEHGHRSCRESEFMECSWAEKPALVIRMLQTLVKATPKTECSASDCTSNYSEKFEEQFSSTLARKFVGFLINLCRSTVINREISKDEYVRCINNLRQNFRFLGDKLKELHFLPDESLLYYMTYDEIKHLINTKDPLVLSKAFQRKRLYQTWDTYKFPELFNGLAMPVVTRKEIRSGSNEGVTVVKLQGTPVCRGVVTGRAACIGDLRHIEDLQNGDILITVGTDVSWTPYFPMLAGIVTELGGIISHGAIVAREIGVPCLIGVKGAFDAFRTGDIVMLDANAGVITSHKATNQS